MEPYRADRTEVSVPVFTDPSGLRRRFVVMAGAGASVLCVVALIVVGLGLFGGPKTPFRFWGGPPPSNVTTSPGGHHGGHDGSQGPTGAGPGASRSPGSKPSPSADPTASPSPSPSRSPHGRRTSPPAYGHTKSPHPHPSHSRAPAAALLAAPYTPGWPGYYLSGPWR